jgi:hypothetical protein
VNNENCAWRIDGELREGDSDGVISVLGQASNLQETPSNEYSNIKFSYFGTRVGVVCLNIPGGPFSEGLSLMRFFRDSSWGTFVDDGDECLSACAFAFMGGTSDYYDGETRLFRTLHVGGRLAFDSPGIFPEEDNGAPGNSGRNNSKLLAATISELTREIFGEKIPYFRLDLLLSLLSLSEGETYEIDSVQKAARYNIDLAGYPADPAVKKQDLYRNICNNLIVRTFGLNKPEGEDDRLRNGSALFEEQKFTESFVRYENGVLERQVELKSVYDLDGSIDQCVIGRIYSTFLSSRFERGSYADVTIDGSGPEGFFSFDPNTQLSDLAIKEADLIKSSPAASDIAEDFSISSYWMHNGSVMALLKGGERGRAFIYAEPRKALRDVGVDVGTLLFDGSTKDGVNYEGFARTFSCGTRRYPVSGNVSEDDRLIVLKGKAAKFDQSCEYVGDRPDKLVFEFLGLASDPEFADKLKPPFGNIIRVRSILLGMMHL